MLWGNGTKTRPNITSPYGPRIGGVSTFHNGTDFNGYTKLYAILGGKVSFAGNFNPAAGYAVVIDTVLPNGVTVTVCHFHVKAGTIAVKAGQTVPEGAYLGEMGETGNATGVCDHLEIRFWKNGSFTTVDPVPWITSMLGGTAGTGGTTDLYGVEYAKDKQKFLASLNLYTGIIDGDFGPASKTATKTFQTWVGFTGTDVDGVFGPATAKREAIVEAGAIVGVNRPIKDVQQALKDKGFYPFTVDGVWGNQSSVGTYRFQAANGLTADAQYGPASDAKLFPVVVPPVQPPVEPPVTGATGKNITQRPNTELQQKLKDKGLYTGAIDGDYGPGTTASVKAFQKSAGLVDDGIYGAMSDVALFIRAKDFAFEEQGVQVTGGTAVAGRVIKGINLHHFGSLGDDRAYFANPMNGRKSCPTIALMGDGKAYGYIPPHLQPWSTGVNDKDRISIEMQNVTQSPDWQISGLQVQKLIKIFVELRMAAINGTKVDGVTVDPTFTLDRQHIQGDQEFRATTCPGPYVMSHLATWIAEAQKQVDALTKPVEPPVEPPVTPPTEPTLVDEIEVAYRELGLLLEQLPNPKV